MTCRPQLFLPRLPGKYAMLCGLLALVSPFALKAQDCVVESPPTLSLPFYDPTEATSAVAWQIKLRGIRGCDARLQIENLDATGRLSLQHAASADRLLVSIATQPLGGSPVPAAPSDAGAVTLAPSQERTLVFWLRADAKQWVSVGPYQQALRVRLSKPTGETMDDRETLLISSVRATARLAFGAGSASGGQGAGVARLDFGELRQGALRSTNLSVLSNTAHTLSLASSGRGRLVNRSNPSSSIPWDLRINGQPVALASGQASLPFTMQGQVLHRIEAQIGAVERVLAGEYADDLLITVTAQ